MKINSTFMNKYLPFASSLYIEAKVKLVNEVNRTDQYLASVPRLYSGWSLGEYLKAGGNGIGLCNDIEAFYGSAIIWLR